MVDESDPRRSAQLIRFAVEREVYATLLDIIRKRLCVTRTPIDEPCNCEPGIKNDTKADSIMSGCYELRSIINAQRNIASRARVRAEELKRN